MVLLSLRMSSVINATVANISKVLNSSGAATIDNEKGRPITPTTTSIQSFQRNNLMLNLKHDDEKQKLYSASFPLFEGANITSAFAVLTQNITTAVPFNRTALANISAVIVECRPPAYHEFPPDAFNQEQRSHGALVIHILVVMYMFYALAIVCDDYFVASLDSICEKLGFSEDVAGATFMAAGSSAPELFTSIIGVFVTKGDVGVGTIVGSAVFNILFVIGLCGLLCQQVVALSWYPVARDSLFYALSVICLILVVSDGIVTWYESLIMLLLYGFYILIMRFNVSLRAAVTNKCKKFRFGKGDMMAANGSITQNFDLKRFQGDYEVFDNEDDDDDVFSSRITPKPSPLPLAMATRNLSRIDEDVAIKPMKLTMQEVCLRLMMKRRFNSRARFEAAVRLVISYRRRVALEMAAARRSQFQSAGHRLSTMSYSKSPRNWFSVTYENENYDTWKHLPASNEGCIYRIKWAISYPIKIVLFFTIPDCRKKRWERWFMVTFILSIVWIAALSYIMVWMVTLIGFTWSIPDSVMGITFLAAGTSIPDAMASVFVARQGMGDMAVSNSIGSNVFDILLGLSLPWFFKTAIIDAGSTVVINSNGMVYSIILLFLTVIIALGAIHMAGWILNKLVGAICLVVYCIYLMFSVMIECNVFGYVNAPMCKE